MLNERERLNRLLKMHFQSKSFKLDNCTKDQFDELYKLAKFHQIHHLLMDTASISSSEHELTDYFEQIKINSMLKMIQHKKKKTDFGAVIRLLEDAGLDYRVLKGMSIERYYENPDVRKVSDIDILLKEADRESVRQAMSKGGYRLSRRYSCTDEDVFKKNGLVFIEAHYRLLDMVKLTEAGRLERKIWKRSEIQSHSGVDFQTCVLEDQFIYMIMHLVKHLWSDVILLRQLVDLGHLIENMDVEDDRLVELLNDFGCYKVGIYLLSIVNKWIDLEIDFTCINKKYQRALINYIYGEKNIEGTYSKQCIHKSYRRYNQKAKGGRLVRIRNVMFPSLLLMKRVYPYLEIYPILLPWSWLIRLGNKMLKDSKRVLSFLRVSKDRDIIDEQIELMNFLDI